MHKINLLLSLIIFSSCIPIDVDVGSNNTGTSTEISIDQPTEDAICKEPEIISTSLSFDGKSIFDSFSYHNEENCLIKNINLENFALDLECIDKDNVSYIHNVNFNNYPKITKAQIKINDSVIMKTFLEFGGITPRGFIYITDNLNEPLILFSSGENLPNNIDVNYPTSDFFKPFKFESFNMCNEECSKENCTCTTRGILRINDDFDIYDANQAIYNDLNFYVSDVKFINAGKCNDPVEFPSSVITFLGIR